MTASTFSSLSVPPTSGSTPDGQCAGDRPHATRWTHTLSGSVASAAMAATTWMSFCTSSGLGGAPLMGSSSRCCQLHVQAPDDCMGRARIMCAGRVKQAMCVVSSEKQRRASNTGVQQLHAGIAVCVMRAKPAHEPQGASEVPRHLVNAHCAPGPGRTAQQPVEALADGRRHLYAASSRVLPHAGGAKEQTHNKVVAAQRKCRAAQRAVQSHNASAAACHGQQIDPHRTRSVQPEAGCGNRCAFSMPATAIWRQTPGANRCRVFNNDHPRSGTEWTERRRTVLRV